MRIAQGLGKETIAEFVETPELEAFLREQGIDHAQGFHIGRPAPIAEPRDRRAVVSARHNDDGRPGGRPSRIGPGGCEPKGQSGSRSPIVTRLTSTAP